MVETDPGYFGSADHIAVQRRAHRLWPFLKHDPRLCHAGRNINSVALASQDIEAVAALAHELGFVGNEFVEESDRDNHTAALVRAGLRITQYNILASNDHTRELSHQILAEHPLPDNFRMIDIAGSGDTGLVRAFQQLNDDCGVATLPAYILRGEEMPVTAALLLDQNGEPAATAGCVLRHPPGTRFGGAVWTGLLATRPDLRGRSLARTVFAHVNLAAYEKLEATMLYAMVQPGNEPSQAACRAAGLTGSRWWALGATSPESFGGEFTR